MKDVEVRDGMWPAISQVAGHEAFSIRVSGRCMEPHLEDHALLTIRKARVYLPGDVLVVQRQNGSPVVHRLIGLFPSTQGRIRYITQADAATTADSPVTREAIVGRICGGQCSPLVVKVPLRHRMKAVNRFLIFLGTRVKQRLWHSPTTS